MTKERAAKKALLYLEWAAKIDKKVAELGKAFYDQYGQFDWSEPIKLGHYSQRRHERVFEARDRYHRTTTELVEKAKRYREKAENLKEFANRNKGDAEAARQEQRKAMDELVSVGTQVCDYAYGLGVVRKVNKKSYTVEFSKGFTCSRDKSYFKPEVF